MSWNLARVGQKWWELAIGGVGGRVRQAFWENIVVSEFLSAGGHTHTFWISAWEAFRSLASRLQKEQNRGLVVKI